MEDCDRAEGRKVTHYISLIFCDSRLSLCEIVDYNNRQVVRIWLLDRFILPALGLKGQLSGALIMIN